MPVRGGGAWLLEQAEEVVGRRLGQRVGRDAARLGDGRPRCGRRKAGSLVLPRWGWARGTARPSRQGCDPAAPVLAISRSASVFLNVMTPLKRHVEAELDRAHAKLRRRCSNAGWPGTARLWRARPRGCAGCPRRLRACGSRAAARSRARPRYDCGSPRAWASGVACL